MKTAVIWEGGGERARARERERERERQTDRQTDRQTNRQTDRQTEADCQVIPLWALFRSRGIKYKKNKVSI